MRLKNLKRWAACVAAICVAATTVGCGSLSVPESTASQAEAAEEAGKESETSAVAWLRQCGFLLPRRGPCEKVLEDA